MARANINNGDTGLAVRTAINDNFIELYAGVASKLDTSALGAGVASNLSGASITTLLRSEVTAATYTVAAADNIGYIPMNRATTQTVTVPLNATVAIPVGTSVTFEQRGVGVITFTPEAGVTLNKLSSNTLSSVGQFGVVTLVKTATNTWNVFGALGAA